MKSAKVFKKENKVANIYRFFFFSNVFQIDTMSEAKKGKKRPKSYYIKCAKGKRQKRINDLDIGMKGFLITCNTHEKEAVRESYNILNEYADKLYGPEVSSH